MSKYLCTQSAHGDVKLKDGSTVRGRIGKGGDVVDVEDKQAKAFGESVLVLATEKNISEWEAKHKRKVVKAAPSAPVAKAAPESPKEK